MFYRPLVCSLGLTRQGAGRRWGRRLAPPGAAPEATPLGIETRDTSSLGTPTARPPGRRAEMGEAPEPPRQRV